MQTKPTIQPAGSAVPECIAEAASFAGRPDPATAADLDQTQAVFEQAESDADQLASDADQTLADRDQHAPDRDQVMADWEPAHAPAAALTDHAHQTSRTEREAAQQRA